MSRFPPVLKKTALGLGKVCLALFTVFALFAAYGYYAEASASRRADAICGSLSPGDEASGLRERAIAEGASDLQTRWFVHEGTDTLFITFIGLPPFSRYICQVEARNGRVVSKKLGRLD